MTDVEKLAYNRGYSAGKKRSAEDLARLEAYAEGEKARYEAARVEERRFRDAVFCAMIPRLTGWKVDGKVVTTQDEHIALAWSIAKAATRSRPT